MLGTFVDGTERLRDQIDKPIPEQADSQSAEGCLYAFNKVECMMSVLWELQRILSQGLSPGTHSDWDRH